MNGLHRQGCNGMKYMKKQKMYVSVWAQLTLVASLPLMSEESGLEGGFFVTSQIYLELYCNFLHLTTRTMKYLKFTLQLQTVHINVKY